MGNISFITIGFYHDDGKPKNEAEANKQMKNQIQNKQQQNSLTDEITLVCH